jgi:hypothetical protein
LLDTWEVEDYLQEEGVYVNAHSGKMAHMDSYMTITLYNKLVPALLKIKDKYTPKQWEEMAENWLHPSAFCPNQRLLGYEVYRTILGRNRLEEIKHENN